MYKVLATTAPCVVDEGVDAQSKSVKGPKADLRDCLGCGPSPYACLALAGLERYRSVGCCFGRALLPPSGLPRRAVRTGRENRP